MAPQPSVSQYELQRAQRIAENKKKMEQMGLLEAAQGLSASGGGPRVALEAGSELQPRLKKQRVQQQVGSQARPLYDRLFLLVHHGLLALLPRSLCRRQEQTGGSPHACPAACAAKQHWTQQRQRRRR
jgi:hypothetical protein